MKLLWWVCCMNMKIDLMTSATTFTPITTLGCLNYLANFESSILLVISPNAFCRCWLWNWCGNCWEEVGSPITCMDLTWWEWIPMKLYLSLLLLNGWYEYSDAINNVSWSGLQCCLISITTFLSSQLSQPIPHSLSRVI